MKIIRYGLSRFKCPPSPRVCRNYSEASTINHQLHPYFITGFSDGESCFHVVIQKSLTHKTGWRVCPTFSIHVHTKDKALLKKILAYFGVGEIRKSGKNSYQFTVRDSKGLKVIIGHFDKYPLLTKKLADYLLFKRIVKLMEGKEHLTLEGLQEVINIKASMNKGGLPEGLKPVFPETKPVQRPVVELRSIPDPNWLVGFTDAEGCFMIKITKSSTNKVGLQVLLKFQVTQHFRDNELIKSFIAYLGCGNVELYPGGLAVNFIVSKFTAISEKIIPFFDRYQLQGEKRLNYLDLVKVAELMRNKSHLTPEGIEHIRLIKSGMNRKRNSD